VREALQDTRRKTPVQASADTTVVKDPVEINEDTYIVIKKLWKKL